MKQSKELMDDCRLLCLSSLIFISFFFFTSNNCSGQIRTERGFLITFNYNSAELTDASKAYLFELITNDTILSNSNAYDIILVAKTCPWESYNDTLLGLKRAQSVKRFISKNFEKYSSQDFWIQEITLMDMLGEDQFSLLQDTLESDKYDRSFRANQCEHQNFGIILNRRIMD